MYVGRYSFLKTQTPLMSSENIPFFVKATEKNIFFKKGIIG